MERKPQTVKSWDNALPYELALGLEELSVILDRYGLSADAYDLLCTNPAFRSAVDMAVVDIRENGLGFKAKARIQAEMLLDTAFKMIHDISTPANVRAGLIDKVVEYSGLNPKVVANNAGGNAGGFKIIINTGGVHQEISVGATIDHDGS